MSAVERAGAGAFEQVCAQVMQSSGDGRAMTGGQGRESGPVLGAALVPRGAAYYPVPAPVETRRYAFILVPGFTLLAFSSAVEPLRIANQLSQLPLYQWQLFSETGAPVASSSGIAVCVDGPLGAALSREGLGALSRDTGLFICAGNPPEEAAAPAVVAALQRHDRFGGVVGGICTGAVGLARAGLLKERAFTLHWENQPAFCEAFPELTPSQNKFESDGRIITCGGGAAATDMMLAQIARDHGAEFSAIVSEMCLRRVVVGEEPAQRSSISALIGSRNPGLVTVVNLMLSHLEDTLTLEELAVAAGYSRRHVERLFLSVLGQTPAEFYRGLRLDRGRTLLGNTDMSLIEVATACGFNSVAHFTSNFKARFGVPPTRFVRALNRAQM